MKFQAIPIHSPGAADGQPDAEVVRLNVSGPIDANHDVMRRARELVVETGSKDMIESFDWAVQHGNFVTEE